MTPTFPGVETTNQKTWVLVSIPASMMHPSQFRDLFEDDSCQVTAAGNWMNGIGHIKHNQRPLSPS